MVNDRSPKWEMDKRRSVSIRLKVFKGIKVKSAFFLDKNPWSSPSIREWNEAESILKAVLKQVQDNETTEK